MASKKTYLALILPHPGSLGHRDQLPPRKADALIEHLRKLASGKGGPSNPVSSRLTHSHSRVGASPIQIVKDHMKRPTP